MLAGGIVAGCGVLAAGTSTAILGIQSTRLPPEQDSNRQSMLAAAALIGFGTLFLIASLVVLFLYQTARKKIGKDDKRVKRLFLIFWILFGIFALFALIGGVIAGILANQEINAGVSGALIAAAILPAAGLILLLVGYFIIRFALKRYIK